MNIITLYELNLPEIVNRELLSLRRKLKRENLLNPYLSNLFKLITQLNNSKDNKVKKARYFNKIYDLILERSTQKQSIFTKNLVFLKEWSLKKRS